MGKPSQRSLELFFLTCCDIDRFRLSVASNDGSAGICGLSGDALHEMPLDDLRPLRLGLRFLHQVWFGEATIAMHEQSVEQRRGAVLVRQWPIEREAAERRAREEGPPDVEI